MSSRLWRLSLAGMVVVAACDAAAPPSSGGTPSADSTRTAVASASPSPSPPPKELDNPWVTPRPAWLGTRVLPAGDGVFAEAHPTPPILRNRRFPTIDILPPPKQRRFTYRIEPVPEEVAQRSSWRPACPVTLDELSYVTMSFWGFDRERHTGEMIVHATVARDVVSVFEAMFEARFPIEEVRVATLREMREWETRPTGDTNLTSSFECRRATGGSNWSAHAYGLAIDINPFHNPYFRGNEVGPELATAYTNRAWKRPGMIHEGDAVVRAFDAIGWGWGGRWSSLKDWMHFSRDGN